MDNTSPDKIFVGVKAKFTLDGKMTPFSIIWEDDTEYEIDCITDVRRAASLKAGGQGTRYTCYIDGKLTYLFYEQPMWFIERK